MASIDCGRADVTADTGSAFPEGQGPALWGFLRAAVVFHPTPSLVTGIDAPFACGVDCCIVVVDEFEEFEEVEEDELARWALFRGMNIRETSSFS